MRFRKRVKVFPGFFLNLSGSGVSATIGGRGASINISKRGTYLNSSIPGTGLYNRTKISNGNSLKNISPIDFGIPKETVQQPVVQLQGEIKSKEQSELTSASLKELHDTLHEVYNDRIELRAEIEKAKKEISSTKLLYVLSLILLVGLFVKWFKQRVEAKQDYLKDVQGQLENSFVDIDIQFDRTFEEKYVRLVQKYEALLSSEIIWDITSAVFQDTKITRSAASTVVTRTAVRFRFDNIDIIKSKFQAFHFENKNGGDLYIYPGFVIMTNNRREFALIDIREFDLHFTATRFLEREKIPQDTKILEYTWAKVNKNGQPDKRFKDNYRIPVVQYGEFQLHSKSGLNEVYAFSNYEKSEEFASVFSEYRSSLS
jgi:hypothetical protein